MLKIPTPEELRKTARLHDLALADEADEVMKQLELVLNAYVRELRALVRRPASVSQITRARDTAQLGRDLLNILQDLGLDQFFTEHQNRFARAETLALEYFERHGIKPSLAGVDTASLDGYITYEQQVLTELVDNRLVKPFRDALLQSNLGTLEPEQVESVLESLISRYEIKNARGNVFSDRQIETLVSDSYVRYQRHVQDEKAKALGLEIYHYLGPDDKITRASCRTMLRVSKHGVAGMLPRSEITTALHPDLRADPLTAGGGWNCRHRWYPVTNEYAREQGYRV